MRALAFAAASTLLACAHPARNDVHAPPTETVPTSACTVRRSAPPSEYRFDARGRLVYAVDQTEHASARRSWFSYDAHGRLVHVHRRIDRIVVPSSVAPVCEEPPCPPPPTNDQDGIDEEYRYDAQGRLVASIERATSYDHQGGIWRDAPAEDGRAASASPAPARGSICDVDPTACPRGHVMVGGTWRPFHVVTRRIEMRYDDVSSPLPTRARISAAETWNVDATRPSQDRVLADDVIEWSYAIEPRVVTRYRVRDGSRGLDRRVERDADGRAARETWFSDGQPSYEVSHVNDDAGRRVRTIRTDRARGSSDESVTTYVYDRLGTLTEVRWSRSSGGPTETSTYAYAAGCSRAERVPEDPRGTRDGVDPIDEPLERFLGRP